MQNDIISDIETTLLLILEKPAVSNAVLNHYGSRKKGTLMLEYDTGSLLRFDDMAPSSCYTAEFGDDADERLFTQHPEMLLAHPSEIIGDEIESAFLFEECFRWVGLRKIKKVQKHVTIVGKYSHVYEYHYREVFLNGNKTYGKRMVAFDKQGNPLAIRWRNEWVSVPNAEGANSILSLSLVEDAHRANTVLACVKDVAEIKFPIALDSYKEIFAIRDSPLTDSGKRKAIIHWVSEHLRKTKKGTSTVKEHTRGTTEITIAGLTISLKPNPRV